MYIIESNTLKAVFGENGTLNTLTSKITGWEIQKRENLGLSWRLLVPVKDEIRNNPVFGEKQKIKSVNQSANEIEFIWENVISEKGGKLDITVTVKVTAIDDGLLWNTKIDNRCPYIVESVYSPYIGDLQHPKGCERFDMFIPCYGRGDSWELYPHFPSWEGDHSVDNPTKFGEGLNFGNPAVPYALLKSRGEGLYCGVYENSTEPVCWYSELLPGYDSAIDGRVPESDEIAGKPVHILFAPVHMCYIMPDESRSLTPVVLNAYKGSWENGVDEYKKLIKRESKTAKAPKWADDVHSWLQIHINSPEDELRMKFKDLPKVAEECAKYGVKAIQLVGWNHGGQDRGNPSHDFDPRLGTFDDLKNAIKECQKMGVKIILFAKFTWADRSTDWYRKELINYSVKDPYGDPYYHGGYEYQTPSQLLGMSARRFAPMCFGCKEYLDICKKEFKKLLDLECDGMLFDESTHHTPAVVCFDTSHNHRYGWPVYANDRSFIGMLRKVADGKDGFLYAGEACYDNEFEEYELSYFRSRGKDHIPLSRYMRPFAQIMTAVSGFNDRNMINQCLMDRYVISYEPYNFKGLLSDFPDTVEYGSKMDNLRRKYRKYFWDGEFKGSLGVKVKCDKDANFSTYSRFEAEDKTSGIVICNYEDHEISVEVECENTKLTKTVNVDSGKEEKLEKTTVIPPRSAIVVM